MPAYLISGPNGSGKSTVGRQLAHLGYKVIEMDTEPGLSAWVTKTTGTVVPATEFPKYPFSHSWLAKHAWLWQKQPLLKIIQSAADAPLFLCGGAYNQKDFYSYFSKRFTLYVDDQTMTKRLQEREPARWRHDSVELAKALAWNATSKQISIDQGSIVIDSARPVAIIVQDILAAL